jgi:hypothetical protein
MCISFNEALERTQGQERALLIGNGFSIEHFSYRNLLERVDLPEHDPLRALFAALRTVDFEAVIHALERAALVGAAYRHEEQARLFVADAQRLRAALVHSIRQTHPEFRDEIGDKIPSCIAFLRQFSTIFSLNYDLLLYWVALEARQHFSDGFGLGEERGGFRGPFKEAAHCNIYNLHGALHLFQTRAGEVEKRLNDGNGIIAAITETISDARRIPLYVAEGHASAKMAKINSVHYLRHCYQKLGSTIGPLFVYGHAAAPNDSHIYRAIFRPGISHLYFCVHTPTAQLNRIEGELARYQRLFRSNVQYTLVDSVSAHVWDRPQQANAA